MSLKTLHSTISYTAKLQSKGSAQAQPCCNLLLKTRWITFLTLPALHVKPAERRVFSFRGRTLVLGTLTPTCLLERSQI